MVSASRSVIHGEHARDGGRREWVGAAIGALGGHVTGRPGPRVSSRGPVRPRALTRAHGQQRDRRLWQNGLHRIGCPGAARAHGRMPGQRGRPSRTSARWLPPSVLYNSRFRCDVQSVGHSSRFIRRSRVCLRRRFSVLLDGLLDGLQRFGRRDFALLAVVLKARKPAAYQKNAIS